MRFGIRTGIVAVAFGVKCACTFGGGCAFGGVTVAFEATTTLTGFSTRAAAKFARVILAIAFVTFSSGKTSA